MGGGRSPSHKLCDEVFEDEGHRDLLHVFRGAVQSIEMGDDLNIGNGQA
jgi:hypothetical protein